MGALLVLGAPLGATAMCVHLYAESCEEWFGNPNDALRQT